MERGADEAGRDGTQSPQEADREVEALRRRVAELEAELSRTAPDAEGTRPGTRPPAHVGGRWRSVLAAVLITLACILAPLSVTAVWASTQVSDTDRYVQTVAPLVDDPSVRSDVADAVTAEIFRYVDVPAITHELLTTLSSQPRVPPRVAANLTALQAPIVSGVEGFTRDQVGTILATPQFAEVWDRANRVAHAELVNLLEGKQGGAVSAQQDTVTLNLGPLVDRVKQQLVARGYTIAEKVPTVDRSLVLVQSDVVTKGQTLYRLLSTLGTWLPFVTLALLAGGVLLARDRRRGLLRGALGVAAAMLVLAVGIAVARPLYLNALPHEVLSRDSAGAVFDTLVRFLRDGLRATAVLALLVALGAFVTGPSAAARRTRELSGRGIGSVRGGAESVGWSTGPVGAWVHAHRRALRVAVVVAGGVVVALWSQPTVLVIVWTTVGVLVALALVEFLAAPAAPVPAAQVPAGPDRTGPGAPPGAGAGGQVAQ